jgi:DNA adenine methylase
MNLLEVLSQMKGRFLLSSYPSDVLNDYIKKYGWKSVEIHRNLGMRKEGQRSKVEVLTANYDMTNS